LSSIFLNELEETIHDLANGKANRPLNISNEMLKHLNDYLLDYIKDFLNKCLIIGNIPEFWKIANLYPKMKL